MDLTIKFNGKDYRLDNVGDGDTIGDLKSRLYKVTRVKPEHQKLMGIKSKLAGKPVVNETTVSQCALRSNSKIMLMGSIEEDIAGIQERPDDLPEVVDDLSEEAENLDIHQMEVYQAKVRKRVEEYKIKELTPARDNKRLLVLDIDYTLFDHRTPAERPDELARPHLHSFLTRAYQHYDIVIWSATSMKWIEVKMSELGVLSHKEYSIAFMLDDQAMISVHIEKRNSVEEVKPLGVIWGKYPDRWSPKNTIMFDDVRRNFLMNPQSGLRISPYRNAHINRDKDDELLRLADYLTLIALREEDFTVLDHRRWTKYVREQGRRNR